MKYVKAVFKRKEYVSDPYFWVVDENNKLLDNMKIKHYIVVENKNKRDENITTAVVQVLDIFESDEPPYDGIIKKALHPSWMKQKKQTSAKQQQQAKEASAVQNPQKNGQAAPNPPKAKQKPQNKLNKPLNTEDKTEKYKKLWQQKGGSVPKQIIYKADGQEKYINLNNVLGYTAEYYLYKALVKGETFEVPSKDKKGKVLFIF